MQNQMTALAKDICDRMQQVEMKESDGNSFESVQQQEGGMDVNMWLEKVVRLPQYAKCFEEDGWEEMDLIKSCLKEEHLSKMKITKTGHRLKIMNALKSMQQSSNE